MGIFLFKQQIWTPSFFGDSVEDLEHPRRPLAAGSEGSHEEVIYKMTFSAREKKTSQLQGGDNMQAKVDIKRTQSSLIRQEITKILNHIEPYYHIEAY